MKTFFMLFYSLATGMTAFAQLDSLSRWQEELVANINEEDFTESSYARLMEMIGDLELNRSDTIFPTRIKQNIILRSDRCLNIREGYHNATADKRARGKAYLGDEWNQTLRYKIRYGDDWTGGLTLNKDAGERFRTQVPFFDSFSAFIRYKSTVVGHYRVKMGSGLILNQQFSLGKNVMSEAFMTSGTALSPHSSTDEYNYMQGVASEFSLGKFRILPFISYKRIDAAVKNDTITSIPQDGYHRTNNEEGKRNQAAVFNAGLHADYRGEWYEVGANLLYTHLSKPFYRPARTYNIYYYRGSHLLQGSLDYHLRRYGFALRGEMAFDQDFNLASISRLSHALGEDWNVSVLYRYYGRKYQQLYASSVSESSSMQGEQGVMLNVSGEPFPHWQAAFMVDYFKLSNIPYGFDEPLSGVELRTNIKYVRSTWDASLSYRMKYKQDFLHGFDAIGAYSFPFGLKLKTQIRSKIFSSQKKGGYSASYALVQAFVWNREDCPFGGEVQFAYFDAADYNTRLYITEKNILYGYGIPMLYGKGLRGSLTAAYKFSSRYVAELKYSWLHYYDRNKISSGLQQIGGKDQYNLWLQFRCVL